MAYILEKEKQIQVIQSCDVLVVGGGVAGISAALAAVRQGVKFILSVWQDQKPADCRHN